MAIGLELAQPSAGATSPDFYTWHNSLRSWVNGGSAAVAMVEDSRWGAVGDDSAENRAAFASLMSAISTATPRKGAKILIPPGIFRVSPASAFSPSISADRGGLTIAGAAPEASVLKTTGSTAGDMLSISSVDNVMIENLTFDMNYPTRTAAGASIGLNNVKHAVIRNCWFPNQADIPIALYRCEDVTIENCYAGNLALGFVRIQDPGAAGATRRIWLDDNDVEDWQKGAVGGHAALQLHGTSTGTIEDIWIRGNRLRGTITNTSAPCVGIGSDMGVNVWILNNRIFFAGGVGEGIAVTGSNYDIGHNHVNNGKVAAGIVLWPETFALNRRFKVHHNMLWDQAQGIAMVWKANNQFWEDVDIGFNHAWDTFTRDGGGSAVQAWGFQQYFDGGTFTGHGARRSTVHDNWLHGNSNGAYSLLSGGQVPSPQAIFERNWTTATTRD